MESVKTPRQLIEERLLAGPLTFAQIKERTGLSEKVIRRNLDALHERGDLSVIKGRSGVKNSATIFAITSTFVPAADEASAWMSNPIL
jgi:predicted ArsR family transcriptional regulator